jgi:GNAT superfamily N-acetyltransferase
VPNDPIIEAVDPHQAEVRAALVQYIAEIVYRIDGVTGFDPSQADAVDDYTPPGGRFLLVYQGERVVGCGAVRTIEPAVGELKRMWIHPDARGAGLGSALLAALVAESRALGHTRLVLDTNSVLVEAIALYRKHGFEPIEQYNDNPDASLYLGRTL